MGWKSRKIFVIKDGDTEVARYDPAILLRSYYAAIDKHGGSESYRQAWQIYQCRDDQGQPLPDDKLPSVQAVNTAEVQILAIARETFAAVGVKSYAENADTGWLEHESIDALTQLMGFLIDSKKNIASLPTPLPEDTSPDSSSPIGGSSESGSATPT